MGRRRCSAPPPMMAGDSMTRRNPESQAEPHAVLLAFAEQYHADLADGRSRSLAEHLARFPGFETWIVAEYHRLRAAVVPDGDERPPVLGGYELLREVGRGGQATVWEARDPRLGRSVAVKVLRVGPAFGEGALRRFVREAELAARLEDPCVCPVLASGVQDGLAWIAMRFVEGRTFAAILAERRSAAGGAVADDALLAVFETLARSLHRVHQLGIVHRDLKPGNLMLDTAGLPVILDFGLALAEDRDSLRTRSGDRIGTPAYMAPEQIRGQAVDARTDVHALGVTLYELVTLQHPFLRHRPDGEAAVRPTAESVWRAILETEARVDRTVVTRPNRDLAAILERALAKEPAARYPDAAAFADDLARLRRGEPVLARRRGPLGRTWSWARRHPLTAGLSAAVLVVVGAAWIGMWSLNAELASEQLATRLALGRSRTLALAMASDEETPRSPGRGLHLAQRAVDAGLGSDPSSAGTRRAFTALHRAWSELREDRVWDLGESVCGALEVLPGGRRFVVACGDGRILVGDAEEASGAAHLDELADLDRALSDFVVEADGGAALVPGPEGVSRVDLRTGRTEVLVQGLPVCAVAAGPETGDLLLGTADRRVVLVHSDGSRRVVLDGLPDVPARVAWIADPGHVAVATEGGFCVAEPLDPDSGVRADWRCRPYQRPRFVAASEGRLVAVGAVRREGAGNGLHLRDLRSGICGEVSGLGEVVSFDVAPDLSRIVLGTFSKGVVLYLAETRKTIPLPGHHVPVRRVLLAADGRILSGGEDRALWIHDGQARAARLLAGHDHWVTELGALRDGRVVSAGLDHTVRLWASHARGDLDLGGDGVWAARAVLAPGGRSVAVARHRAIEWRSFPEGRLLATLPTAGTDALLMEFTPDGTGLLSSCEDRRARFHDLRGVAGEVVDVGALELDADNPRHLVAVLDDRHLAVLGAREVYVFDREGRRVKSFELPSEARALAVDPNPDGAPRWLCGDEHGNVSVQDLEGRDQRVANLGRPIAWVEWVGEGELVMAVSDQGDALLVDSAAHELTVLGRTDDLVAGIAVRPDGERVAVARKRGVVELFDRAGRPVLDLAPLDDGAAGVCWSPDGESLAVWSSGGEVVLCDATTGAVSLAYAALDVEPRRVAFHPDGQSLLLSGVGNRVAVWPTSREGLLRQVREADLRALRPTEVERLEAAYGAVVGGVAEEEGR